MPSETDVGLNHIQVAGRLLDRIAASGGEGQEMMTLMRWRESVGIETGSLEIESVRSAEESVDEIRLMAEEGYEISYPQIAEFLAREFMAGFQVGFIVAARQIARRAEQEPSSPASTLPDMTDDTGSGS